jgi:hypothetical protein
MVVFSTNNSQELFNKFQEAISSYEITTWRIDDRHYVTYTSSQWTRQAWLIPMFETNQLSFLVRPNKNQRLTRNAFIFYQTAIIETFLFHFNASFDRASVTANAAPYEY